MMWILHSILNLLTGNTSLKREFKPVNQICEYLNALHVYADEARQGKISVIESTHFCSHVGKDFRQCLIYDSASADARLIGVEYMVPRHVYETFDPEEQRLWHSHEFEVKSGMLILPKPDGVDEDTWRKLEVTAMGEVVGLYGKTWHFWRPDLGEKYPFGMPRLMGSLTSPDQLDLDKHLEDRNRRFSVDHRQKAKERAGIEPPGVHPNADSWWKTQASR